MLIRRADEIDGRPVAMAGVRDVEMRMLVGRDDGAENFSMRHFTVAPGGHTPRHEHGYEHEVFVLAGQGRVEFDGETHPIRAGDALLVEPNRIHQFTNDSEDTLAFLCLVPSSFDCGGEAVPTPGS